MPLAAAFLPFALLTACAHQPQKSTAVQAVAVAPAVAVVPVSVPAPAPADAGSGADAVTADAASPLPDTDTQPAVAEAGALPGPPADSVVVAKQSDLFDRIRGGFGIDDVDQPAVDSQLNWFANHPDYLERTFARSELWMYYIVGQLEQRHMPRELALLPVIESAFEPYAYSRARASGLWQFISDTGRRFGLKQDWWYDGRRDPVEATRAALDYLQELHDEFDGDWLLAIAAYNCGELAVSRAVERNQRLGKPTDFWHLKLPNETRGYVPELLAMKRLVANPARYGLEFSHIPNEPYFVQISTGGQIDLQVVADIAGISSDDLYELNPAFHRWATDPTGPDRLLVPVDAAEGLQQTLLTLTADQRMRVEHYTVRHGDTVASIAQHFVTKPEVVRQLNNLGPNDPLVIDTPLRVPAQSYQLPEKAMRAAMLVDSPTRRGRHHGRPVLRVVRRGDTLYGIAARVGTDVQTLAQLNGMKPGDSLRAGQRLRIEGGSGNYGGPSLVADKSVKSASASDGRRTTYIVRRGDTLYSIARLLQVTVNDLLGWNGMAADHGIKPGQTLVAFVRTHG